MQVDPIKPTLEAPVSKRLMLECDEPPSHFAFKFSFAAAPGRAAESDVQPRGISRRGNGRAGSGLPGGGELVQAGLADNAYSCHVIIHEWADFSMLPG
jgi:hypothetical protein